MKSIFSLASFCVALALGAGTASAAAVRYDFSVGGNAGAGIGSFQYDDATGSQNGFGEFEFELTAFSFDFGGGSFNLGDLSQALAVFDGSTLLGLDAVAAGGAFSLLPAVGSSDAFLVSADQKSSTVSFRLDNGGGNTVPEPATFGLALAAAGAAFALRRRRTV